MVNKKLCEEFKKNSPRIKVNSCEYQLPNCQKTADMQIITRLGSVNIAKYWACHNCGEIVERERKLQKLASENKRNPN